MHRDPKVRGEIVGHRHPRPPSDRPQGPCELQEPWPTLVAAYAADLPRLHVLHRRRQRLTPANTKYPRLAQGEVFGKDSCMGCRKFITTIAKISTSIGASCALRPGTCRQSSRAAPAP